MAFVIGLNSGSSFDGIDAVLEEIFVGPDGHPTKPRFVDGISYKWPDSVAHRVLKAFNNEVDTFEMCRLNYEAGAVFAEATKELLKKTRKVSDDIAVIGFDGQTIYQEPPDRKRFAEVAEGRLWELWSKGMYGCGVQIGEQAVIAAHTNITTVSHFRPADHAFGGTGAPLMQYFDFVTFRDIGPVLTLNIGGIANCQLANRDRRKMKAFDTGPGNVMSDYAMRKLFDEPYDPDGRNAARGTVVPRMLAELMEHPFLKREPPRSAWRLDFGEEYAGRVLAAYASEKREDILATFCAFTANCIVTSISANIPDLGGIKTIIASGGGVRNKTIMRFLEEKLPKTITLAISDSYGVPAQFKEAMKFGTLGFAAINQIANNVPACSGATRFTIMGKISYAPRFAKATD